MTNYFPHDDVPDYDFTSYFTLFDVERETVTDGRVFSPKACELLYLIRWQTSGKIGAIIMLRGVYHTMTGEKMGLRDAKYIVDFYFDNYEG